MSVIITRMRSSRNPYSGEITSIEEVTDEDMRTRRFIHVCDQAAQKRELATRRSMDEETERLADMAMEDQQ